MKDTVVTLDEIATALKMKKSGMAAVLGALYTLGFPQPISSEVYEMSKVLDWVVAQQEMNLALVTMLSQKIE